jgi:hypothetical protein
MSTRRHFQRLVLLALLGAAVILGPAQQVSAQDIADGVTLPDTNGNTLVAALVAAPPVHPQRLSMPSAKLDGSIVLLDNPAMPGDAFPNSPWTGGTD